MKGFQLELNKLCQKTASHEFGQNKRFQKVNFQIKRSLIWENSTSKDGLSHKFRLILYMTRAPRENLYLVTVVEDLFCKI